jgi:hypothetical protein
MPLRQGGASPPRRGLAFVVRPERQLVQNRGTRRDRKERERAGAGVANVLAGVRSGRVQFGE